MRLDESTLGNGSPFKASKSPITPKTMNAAGQGGQANPAYLQTFKQPMPGMLPTPVVTPKPSVGGDTIAQFGQSKLKPMPSMRPSPGPITPTPSMITPKMASPTLMDNPPDTRGGLPGAIPANAPLRLGSRESHVDTGGAMTLTPKLVQSQITPKSPDQAGGNTLGDVYKFFASDLQNQAKQAKSGAIADAAKRGVYYGTPLTGSEADIDTQYLRGLGQLQSGMYSNEQENQLRRLGMATNLIGPWSSNAPDAPQGMDWSGLGSLFSDNQQPMGQSITPKTPAPKAPPINKGAFDELFRRQTRPYGNL